MIFLANILTHCKSLHYFQFPAVALMMAMVSNYAGIAHTKKKWTVLVVILFHLNRQQADSYLLLLNE